MKKTLNLEKPYHCTSLLSDITYRHAPYWFDSVLRPLKMSLLLPKHRELCKEQPLPVLVWCCGGAFKQVDKDVWLPEFVEFAKAGFAVASVEYRTSNVCGFPAPVEDVKSAIRYLRAHAEELCIDKTKVFLAGESAGGNLAATVGVTGDVAEFEKGDYLEQSSTVQGVIDFYGPVTVHTEFGDAALQDHGERINPMRVYFASTDIHSEVVKKAEVLSYINEKTPPFLVFHGTNDRLVPVEQSEVLYETLTKKQVPCDLYILEGKEHGADDFFQPEIKAIMLDFLKKNCNK